jgi:hypothetical protein
VEFTKNQKNAMLEAIVANGLSATEFDIVPEPRDSILISHLSTGSYFSPSRLNSVEFSIRSKVGDYRPKSALTTNWDNLLKLCDAWARDLKEDVETPDLWAAVRRTREFISEPKSTVIGQALFTPAEQAEITTQIREIENYIRESLPLANDEFLDIVAKLDEADEAASRINRKDWLLLCMGVMFTLIVTGLVPPSTVQHIFDMVLHGLSHLFGADERPPGLPTSII